MKKVYDLSRKVAENYTSDHVFFFHLKEDNSECPHKVTEIFTAIFNHKIFLLYFFFFFTKEDSYDYSHKVAENCTGNDALLFSFLTERQF